VKIKHLYGYNNDIRFKILTKYAQMLIANKVLD